MAKHWVKKAVRIVANGQKLYNAGQYVYKLAQGNNTAGTSTPKRGRSPPVITEIKKKMRRSSGSKRSLNAVKRNLFGGRSSRRSFPNRNSKSAGFISKGRRASQRPFSGIQVNYETGGTVTAVDMMTIGHATIAVEKVIRIFWLTLLKKLMIKGGKPCVRIEEDLELNLTDTVQLIYSTASNVSRSTQTYTVTGVTTLDTLAIWFSDAARGYNVTANSIDQYKFISLSYNPTDVKQSRKAFMELELTSFNLYSKSNFKHQNRSVDDLADNQIDDVDNVPIVGRTFEGHGTGVNRFQGVNGPASGNFVAQVGNGLVSYTAITTGNNDLPEAREFDRKVSVGKCRLDPGDIKTSQLVSTHSGNISKFYYSCLVPRVSPSTLTQIKPYGKFRFMCYCKMIDAAFTAQPMTIAFELHSVLKMSVNEKRSYQTQVAWSKDYL